MGGQRGTGYVYFGVYNSKCYVLHGFLAYRDERGFTDSPVYLDDTSINNILSGFDSIAKTFKVIQ
jgi:hypothetical protein